MGLFDFFKKNKTQTQPKPEARDLIMAMPMFNNGESYDLKVLTDHLKDFWGLKVTDMEGDESSAVFKIDGETIVIATMPVQIPWDDIKSVASLTYIWENAEEELKDHNRHAIVSLIAGSNSPFERFSLFSKILCSILMTSNAVGIYHGSQSLLISKEQYLSNIDELREGNPVATIWIYIGIRPGANGVSLYTYGMNEFYKQEMEIINSSLPLEEIFPFLVNICNYVIGSDVTFRSGETLGYTAEQKIQITSTKGTFVDGEVLRLEM